MEWGNTLIQPEIVSVAIYVLLLLCIMKEEKYEKLKIFEIIIILFIIGSIIAAVLAAMYLTWTPTITPEVGGLDVIGVQGRYFIPIILMIIMFIPNKFLEAKNKVDDKIIYISLLICQLPSLLNIIVRNIN